MRMIRAAGLRPQPGSERNKNLLLGFKGLVFRGHAFLQPFWIGHFLGTLPIPELVHPRRAIHEFVMRKRYRWMAYPERIEFILNFQHPFMVVGTIFRPGKIHGLVRPEERGIEPVLDVHLRGVEIEQPEYPTSRHPSCAHGRSCR